MKCVVKFSIDNAAFHLEPYDNSKQKKETLDLGEVGRIVSNVGNDISGGCRKGRITDANGNTVGEFCISGR